MTPALDWDAACARFLANRSGPDWHRYEQRDGLVARRAFAQASDRALAVLAPMLEDPERRPFVAYLLVHGHRVPRSLADTVIRVALRDPRVGPTLIRAYATARGTPAALSVLLDELEHGVDKLGAVARLYDADATWRPGPAAEPNDDEAWQALLRRKGRLLLAVHASTTDIRLRAAIWRELSLRPPHTYGDELRPLIERAFEIAARDGMT